MKIVCIDDSTVALKQIQGILKSCTTPYDEIKTFHKPDPALEHIKMNKVDLVLTDLVIPEKDGLEILRDIKELKPCIEVIVITGKSSIESAVKAIKNGARDYIEKPVTSELLQHKITSIHELLIHNRAYEESLEEKDYMEDKVNRQVSEMEIKLDRYMETIENITAVLGTEQNEMKKNKEVMQIIEELRNKNCK